MFCTLLVLCAHLELHAVDEVAVAGDVRLLEHAEHRDLALAEVAHADAQLVLVSRVKHVS